MPPPNGFIPARVDADGRLQLPGDVKQYLLASGGNRVFITSLDKCSAKIYTAWLWEVNKQFLAEFQDDPDAAEDVLFTANDVGADCDVDHKGRVVIPQALRQLLSLENQSVRLECFPGVINIYGPATYESRRARADNGLPDKVRALRKKGLK